MYLIKSQQPCFLTQFKKPELLEDKLHYIALHHIYHIPALAVSSSSVLCSPQPSSTVVLTVFPASAVSEEEIHYPVAWQLGGRSGTLPVGAARSQLGVLPEQQFARQTRCSLVVLNFILLL